MIRTIIPLLTLIFSLIACSGAMSERDLWMASPPSIAVPVQDVPVNQTNNTFQEGLDAEVVPRSDSGREIAGSTDEFHLSPSTPITRVPVELAMSPEGAVAAELAASIPPERNDRRLAAAFRGISESSENVVPTVTEPLTTGTEQTFTILNVTDKTVSEIEAELLLVSEKAYFWFDKGTGSVSPDQAELEWAADAFDEIYQTVAFHFGSESNPGIDGDPLLHIVHASPIALCGVTEDTIDQCSLSGLVNSTDLLPKEIDPRSNEREMFVMNTQRFGTDSYLGILAHELRHLIEDNYDKSDEDWEVEGSAVLAAQLAGVPSSGAFRANLFLNQPDQQLNSWVEEGTGPYYGQSYLFNRYVFDQLGETLYRDFATSPLPGLKALDAMADEGGFNLDGQTIWLNYLVALAIHDDPQAPAQFQFESSELSTVTLTPIAQLPSSVVEQVSQYAADFYEVPAESNSISFSGAVDVPLLDVEPVSGDRYWYAQRANYSNPRLTFSIDLRELEKATLNYDLYADIEQGYDFAYVSVSLDNGRTWVPLESDQMQGLEQEDNPSGSALADRFYTGRIRRWIKESIEISEFAGEQILLRFEYVTDPILTYGGVALDNIAIPELGFSDGAEERIGEVTAEGFTRATARIPQTWHLQHITFTENGPQVRYLAVDADGELFLPFKNKDQQASVLIIAASAPTTLQKAVYEFQID